MATQWRNVIRPTTPQIPYRFVQRTFSAQILLSVKGHDTMTSPHFPFYTVLEHFSSNLSWKSEPWGGHSSIRFTGAVKKEEVPKLNYKRLIWFYFNIADNFEPKFVHQIHVCHHTWPFQVNIERSMHLSYLYRIFHFQSSLRNVDDHKNFFAPARESRASDITQRGL